jgi:hypothetical protein
LARASFWLGSTCHKSAVLFLLKPTQDGRKSSRKMKTSIYAYHEQIQIHLSVN